MNAIKKIFLPIVSLTFVTFSSAITWVDVDVDGNEGEPDYFKMQSWNYQTSTWDKTFDILADGFDTGLMEVTSTVAYFAFDDDGDKDKNHKKREYFDILMGGYTLMSWQEVDGSHSEGYDWYSFSLSSALIGQLQDGILEYSVIAQKGDAYLKEAKIVAEGREIDVRVPDSGATGLLLAFSLVSLLAVAKHFRAARG